MTAIPSFADAIETAALTTINADDYCKSGGTGSVVTREKSYPQPDGSDVRETKQGELPLIALRCKTGRSSMPATKMRGFRHTLEITVITEEATALESLNSNVAIRDHAVYAIAAQSGSVAWVAGGYQVLIDDDWTAGEPTAFEEMGPFYYVSKSTVEVTVHYQEA